MSNHASPLSRLRIFLISLLFGTGSAGASVIYDVEVNYAANVRLTFSMEFNSPPSPALGQTDLVSSAPSSDFTNERLIVDNVEWVLSVDFPVAFLSFNGVSFDFKSNDVFTSPPPSGDASSNQLYDSLFLVLNGEPALLFTPTGGVTITQRGSPVPMPATNLLLLLGAGMLWCVARKPGQLPAVA